MTDKTAMTGELVHSMTEVEWLEYETLILEVSDFGDSSEIDGLISMAWASGVALADSAFIERYFHPGEDPEILPRVIQLLQRHAAWVQRRCAKQPEQLSADVPRLSFEIAAEEQAWAISFDPQLWLLGWQRGLDDLPIPELGPDERLVQAFELIARAADQTAQAFSSAALDEAVEIPADVSVEDYAEELLDLATPEELALSAGVAMTISLVPKILPTLRETDAVTADDLLADLEVSVEQAYSQLHADADESDLESSEQLFAARMDWVSGADEKLPEGFHAASASGRLAQAKVAEIEAGWNAQIVAKDGLPFEYVDGFLSAHHVTPNNDSFDLQHTLFPLFAEQAEQLDDDIVVEIIRGLEAFHGHIGARGVLDDDCEQLLGVPAQVDRHLDADEVEAAQRLGERWSEGFRSGLSYFCPVFGTYMQQDKMLFALILPLIQLSFQPEGLEHEFTLAERRELVAGIPETLVEIAKRMAQQARTPVRQVNKVGRNDPCPCGSGKKYKKCCGAS